MIRSRIGSADGFGDRLRHSRERLRPDGRRMTQERLAMAVGVERNTVSRWENGGMLPKDPGVVAALAGVLGVTADWLIAGDAAGTGARSGTVAEPTAPGKYADPAAGELPARTRAVLLAYLERLRERECTQEQIDGAGALLLAGARNGVSSVALANRTEEQLSADVDAAWDLVVRILRRDGIRL